MVLLPLLVSSSRTPLRMDVLALLRSFATAFPQVALTAQSFDKPLFHDIASIISTEARAMNNAERANLTYWSPNVNVYRGTILFSPPHLQILAGAVAKKLPVKIRSWCLPTPSSLCAVCRRERTLGT